MASQTYQQRIANATARIRAKLPDISEKEARKMSRGHGLTPEHGKAKAVPVGVNGAVVTSTASGQAAYRAISHAAQSGQRVSIELITRDGKAYKVFTNPSSPGRHNPKAGMTAKEMRRRIRQRGGGANLKKWLQSRPWMSAERAAEYDEAGVPALDIAEINITAY